MSEGWDVVYDAMYITIVMIRRSGRAEGLDLRGRARLAK